MPVCRDMLNAFFLPDAETEAAMTLIEQQWQAIIAEGFRCASMATRCRCHYCVMNWHSVWIKNVSASVFSPDRLTFVL
ncbi:hypothetical protein ACP0HM_16060 [Escherichia coli]